MTTTLPQPIDNASELTLDEIFDMIADAECEVFHLSTDNPDNEELDRARVAMRTALEAFARATGKMK
jgi:phosphoribosyl 1,2-cyclic phosphodiesterase